MRRVEVYMKAVTGTLVAGLGAIQTGLSDGHLTAQECVTALVAAIAALGVIYTVPTTGGPDSRTRWNIGSGVAADV